MAVPDAALEGYDRYRGLAHFGALDGVRFFAIAGVLVHHSPLVTIYGDQIRLFTRGFLGVDLFFVLSGFLISSLLLRERARTGRISLKGFYKRRALRILPLYFLVVTAIAAYYVLVKPTPGAAGLWPWYYLFLANFMTGHISLLGTTWSLSVEEQYYTLWPLLLALLPARALLWGIGTFSLGYAVLTSTPLGYAGVTLGPLRLALVKIPYVPILLGAGLAMLLDRRESFVRLWPLLGRKWASPLLALLIVAEIGWLLPADLHGWPNLVLHLTMAAFLGSVVIREDTPLAPFLQLRPIVRIGMVSYGIYLLHLIADHLARVFVGDLLGPAEDWMTVYLPLYFGLCWLMAEISFRFYETPFLALRHKPLGFLPRAKQIHPPKEKLPS